MKTLLRTCILGLLVVTAPMANAQGFLSLAQDDCLADGGLQSQATNCATNNFSHWLVSAFELSAPAPSFVGNELVFDMQEEGAVSLSPWWQWDAAGCRAGGLAPLFDPTLNPNFTGSTCQDPFALSSFGPSGGIGRIERPSTGTGLGLASQRVIIGVVLRSDDPVALDANQDYTTTTLRFRASTTQTAACPGCQAPVVITFNSVFVGQLPGAPGGDVTITDPKPFPGQQGAFFSNCVSYNGASSCPSGATPAAQHTWGQLKSLYR